MNTEQIIQSTDPGLRLLRLHPSCYVFTVARSQNLIPSHRVQSCEPNQSDVLLKGTVGSCSVWEKQKRFLCGVKHAKICSLLIAQLLECLIDPDRYSQYSETGTFCPVHIVWFYALF